MRASLGLVLAAALLLPGCVEEGGVARRAEWQVDLLEANFRCERGSGGVIAQWMGTTGSSIYLHVLSTKRVPCEVFIGGKYRAAGQEVRVELVNGIVQDCAMTNEVCVLDTAMSLAEPAVDPGRDVRITVVVPGGPTLSTLLPGRT